MSEQDPNRDLKPSAFDEWWAEVQEWREKRRGNRFDHKTWFRKNDAKRRKRHSFNILGIFGVIGGLLLVIIELFAGLFFWILRLAFWLGGIMFVIWLLTDINLTNIVVETEDGTVKSERIENVSSFLNKITDDIKAKYEKASNNIHIQIRTTGEDGTDDVIEFGNKLTKPTPPLDAQSTEEK